MILRVLLFLLVKTEFSGGYAGAKETKGQQGIPKRGVILGAIIADILFSIFLFYIVILSCHP